MDEYFSVGCYQTCLRRSCRKYRKRRGAMISAVKRYWAGIQINSPPGGLFFRLQLPENVSSLKLLSPVKIDKGVEFATGDIFFLNRPEGEQYVRLNFVAQTPEDIQQGTQGLTLALGRPVV